MAIGGNGTSRTILELKDLYTHFYTPEGTVRAVDGVSYDLKEGETLGVVGESGCGKTVTALSILNLIPSPPGKIFGGGIFFQGKDLTKMPPKELRKVRGNLISMIFQEPMTSLNPCFTVGFQITEALAAHLGDRRKAHRARAAELLGQVGIPAPESRSTTE